MTEVLDKPAEMNLDLFGEESLKDPFGDYRRLRDAGPVVWLPALKVHALGRFADVLAALRAHEVLKSGDGVGFSEAFNAARGMNVLQSDGELHIRLRATVMRPLAPAQLRQARADLKAMVAERVASLAGKGSFEAMTELAAFLPVQAISHLVGLPGVGRERMLEWAAATFNLIGPHQDPKDFAALGEMRSFMASLSEDTVRDGSWAGELFAAARSGRLSQPEAMGALSAYIVPSLDTTLLAKGHLLHDLAANPEQWAMVKADPGLIPSAVLESVRRSAVIRWFSRVAAQDYDVSGVTIPQGARVMLLYGSANRDERRYHDPDSFDVRRDARDQLAWGAGAHMCAGMHLARLEMEVLVEALVEADARLEAGGPVPGTNRGLFGFAGLPYRIEVG